jgi:predicted CXXCH cytochrome family protein
MPRDLSRSLLALAFAACALVGASCHADLARPCDPFRTPRLQSPPLPKGEERSSHAPFILGDCSACHSAPANAVDGMQGNPRPGPAYAPVNENCVSCHGELFRAPPPRHPPQQSFCTTCHNPHNSRLRSLLLDDDRTRACLDYPPPYPEGPAPAPRKRRASPAATTPQ